VLLALALRSPQMVFPLIAADQQTVCPTKRQTVRGHFVCQQKIVNPIGLTTPTVINRNLQTLHKAGLFLQSTANSPAETLYRNKAHRCGHIDRHLNDLPERRERKKERNEERKK